jgi:hypothetical protein
LLRRWENNWEYNWVVTMDLNTGTKDYISNKKVHHEKDNLHWIGVQKDTNDGSTEGDELLRTYDVRSRTYDHDTKRHFPLNLRSKRHKSHRGINADHGINVHRHSKHKKLVQIHCILYLHLFYGSKSWSILIPRWDFTHKTILILVGITIHICIWWWMWLWYNLLRDWDNERWRKFDEHNNNIQSGEVYK